MNTIDKKILTILQLDASTPKAEIGRQVGLAPSAVFERIRKLENRGVITGYEARFCPKSFGLDVLAFVFVAHDQSAAGRKTGPQLALIPGVEEVHKIAGDDCFLVKVRAESTQDLARLLDDHFSLIKSIRNFRTTIVLETVKESPTVRLVDSAASCDGSSKQS